MPQLPLSFSFDTFFISAPYFAAFNAIFSAALMAIFEHLIIRHFIIEFIIDIYQLLRLILHYHFTDYMHELFASPDIGYNTARKHHGFNISAASFRPISRILHTHEHNDEVWLPCRDARTMYSQMLIIYFYHFIAYCISKKPLKHKHVNATIPPFRILRTFYNFSFTAFYAYSALAKCFIELYYIAFIY